jgi:hypothetical protein
LECFLSIEKRRKCYEEEKIKYFLLGAYLAKRLTREVPSKHAFEFCMKAYMLYAIIRAEKLMREEEKRMLMSASSQ